MLSVVIIIIVLVILATVAITNSTKPIDQATEARYQEELAQVKRGVDVKRISNAKKGTKEEDINSGFIKVKIEDNEDKPENFVSFDEGEVTGYVVDLATIEYEKLQFGHGYLDLIKGDTIKFKEHDVYVYDAAGKVYYAKGFVVDDDTTFYSENAEDKRVDGPIVDVLETANGNVKLEVTPMFGGAISSVVVGGKLATSSDGRIFTINLADNGSYIGIATEEGGSSTRFGFTVSDVSEEIAGTPKVINAYINSQEEYTKNKSATLHVEAENATYIAIKMGDSSTPSIIDTNLWRKYTTEYQIRLTEGENIVYLWAKNANDEISSAKLSKITLDSYAPTREAPTYEVLNYKLIITGCQTDDSQITYEYGYRKVGEETIKWQSTNVVENVTAGSQYVILTRAKDSAGNESESRSTTTDPVLSIPSGVGITSTPETWSGKKEVTITYPNTYGVAPYSNLYRIDGGEWKKATSNNYKITVMNNGIVEAAVAADFNGTDTELGEITSLEISKVDRYEPSISNIKTTIEDNEGTAKYFMTANIEDEESGLVAWAVTKEDVEPTAWNDTFEATNEKITISYEIFDNNTYYIWAKDDAGTIASEKALINTVDVTDPVIKTYTVSYGTGKAVINAIIQDISLGLTSYAVVRGENTVPTRTDWIDIEQATEEFVINHEVSENDFYTIWARDVVGKTASVTKNIKVNFKVTYDYTTNGGESINIGSNEKYQGCNTEIDLTPIATKTNNTFIGWNTDPNATEGLTSLKVGTVEDVVLYAIFSKNLEISLVYYDGASIVRETIKEGLYNADTETEITLPNIDTTYTGWVASGWTTSTANNAVAEYSGDDIKIKTKDSMTLYMTYKKNISATCRYYTYKTLTSNTNTSSYLYVEEINDNGTIKYNAYYPTSSVETITLATNAYNIQNVTTGKVTLPNVPTSVKANGSSNTWTFRGFSESQMSDAEVSYARGEEIHLTADKTLYASYKTTVTARKHVYDAAVPQTATGNITMTYNAVISPATVSLGIPNNITHKNETWVPRGWSTQTAVNAVITVENDGTAEIYSDTDYYAMYQRDVEITSHHYGNQTKTQTSKAYLSYAKEEKEAEFIMAEIDGVDLDGKTWNARGYSIEKTPGAEVTVSAGEKVKTIDDLTYYISYYNNLKVTKHDLNKTSTIEGTAYVAHDGTAQNAKVNLGQIENEQYDGYEWIGAYWSDSDLGNAEETVAMDATIEVSRDTDFYAVFNREVVATKYVYPGTESEVIGLATLNASGKKAGATINLGTATDVTKDGKTWSLKEWTTSNDLTEGTVTEPNKSIELYKDTTYYALYKNNLNMTAHYMSEAGNATSQIIGGTARLTYDGQTTTGEGAELPTLANVIKDNTTWVPVGYLSSADGYTITDIRGSIAGKGGDVVTATNDISYFAIYEASAVIEKVEYAGTSTITKQVAMNSQGNKSNVVAQIGTIDDVIIDGNVWTGNGWSKTKTAPSTPDITESGEITVTGNATYYASYQRELAVERREFETVGKYVSNMTKANAYMNVSGEKISPIISVAAPTKNTVTIENVDWNFKGWTISDELSSPIYTTSNTTLEINDDIVLYAKYERTAKATLYSYNNLKNGEYEGVAQANSIGNIAKAKIQLPTIVDVVNNGETWTGRGWSTNTGSTAGENFVAPGGNAEIAKDATYYASYKKTITTSFVSYDGSEKVTKTRSASGYLNYLGDVTGATVVVPTAATYAGWSTDGYTMQLLTLPTAPPEDVVSGIVDVTRNNIYYALYYRTLTLTYDANGGTPTPVAGTGIQIASASDITKTMNPEIKVTTETVLRDGYNFTNMWTETRDSLDKSVTAGENYEISDNTTLYAYWEPKQYTVSYDLRGGTGTFESQTKYHGIDIVLNGDTPTKVDDTFKGWTIDENSSLVVYAPGETFKLDQNTVLYAVWENE